MWVDVKDELPNLDGQHHKRIKVIMRIGSMSPKEKECNILFKHDYNGGHFLEGDWQTVLKWWKE